MNETEPPPQELLGLFQAERAVQRVAASVRVALRARLAASFAQEAPLDELRVLKTTRGEMARATAQEPIAAPPTSGRTKGKMNLSDKRIIGAATLIAAATGLIGVTVYKRHVDAPPPQRQDHGPTVDLGRSPAMTPRFSPVAPTTGADLAITAGESAWIHAPFGAVDIEIQSQCNAEVELSLMSNVAVVRESERADASALLLSTKPSGVIVAGTDSPDGRASTYHLTPGLDLFEGIYEYTSRCAGQPPTRGNIVVDRVGIGEPLGGSARPMTPSWFMNARVDSGIVEHGLNVFGTVLPGARVSIGTRELALVPTDPTGSDPQIYPTFTTDVPVSPEHLVVAVRVDDANGAHFYVLEPSGACTTTMTAPKQTAAMLDAQGYHTGALKVFEAVMAACKPDRQTLSLAFEYACKARDSEAARKYWRKLPAALQRTLQPLCARNDITWEALNRP